MKFIIIIVVCLVSCLFRCLGQTKKIYSSNIKVTTKATIAESQDSVDEFSNDKDFEDLRVNYKRKRKGRIICKKRGEVSYIELYVKSLFGWKKHRTYLCDIINDRLKHHYMRHLRNEYHITKEYIPCMV